MEPQPQPQPQPQQQPQSQSAYSSPLDYDESIKKKYCERLRYELSYFRSPTRGYRSDEVVVFTKLFNTYYTHCEFQTKKV